MNEWDLRPARDLGLPPVQRFRSFQRESGLIQTAFHQAWWWMVYGYLSVGHRLKVIGRERIPTKPPFILLSNHCSHLDALVLAAPLSCACATRYFQLPRATSSSRRPRWRRLRPES